MNDALVWIDIETTGLSPEEDYILEIGCIVTDMQLNELGRFHKYDFDFTAGFSDHRNALQEIIDTCHPTVLAMHEKSMLWTDLEEQINNSMSYGINRDLGEVMSQFLKDLQEKTGVERLYPAGSSVHFDISFLKNYYPEFTSLLSHRHLDVTSLKLASAVATGEYPTSNGDTEHRAIPDIQESMEWFKNYIFPEESASTHAAHLLKLINITES